MIYQTPCKPFKMKRTLVGSLALSRLKHDTITVIYGKTKVKGIFIPFKHNHIQEQENKAVYMPVRVLLFEQANRFGQHGMITQSVESSMWKEGTEVQREDFRNLPILGNLKDFDLHTENINTMDNEQSQPVTRGDDLPF
jgi:hypothetical protein